MKPPKGDVRKLTDIRVTRKTNVELAHGDSHGWAVSYADLLMVLLSFFVLYFSFAEEDPNSVHQQLQKIAMSMQGMSKAEIEQATRKPDAVAAGKLSDALKVEGLKVTQSADELLVELETGVFNSGSYKMSGNLRSQVDTFLGQIEPFKANVSLTVIGHADKRKMIPRNEFLQDNFDLSSQRALHVLKYVLSKGFPAQQAAARAASSYDRDARSITFRIRLAQDKKPGEST